MFKYTEEKIFSQAKVQQLFLSVNWVSGNYPERLYKALMNSSTVLTVWDGEKLVGLIRVLDDTEMLAQIHYVLVHPDKNNVPFYVKNGFSVMENGAAIQICNLSEDIDKLKNSKSSTYNYI